MTDRTAPRSPRAFAPDDPALEISDEIGDVTGPSTPRAAIKPGGAKTTKGVTDEARPAFSRPTLADLDRGWRWGAIFVGALTAAAGIAASVTFARFVSAAVLRDDWIGWLTVGLLGLAGVAALVLVGRELAGMLRLARLGRMKSELAGLATAPDAAREKAAVRRLLALYESRPALAGALAQIKAHGQDVRDPGDLVALADRTIMAPLDDEARRIITASAKRVATVTAMSPIASLTIGFVLVENLRQLRMIATLYGGRPGYVGSLRLARMVIAHIIATGGLALTDDLLGQFLGQDVLRRLSRRLGEGAFNGTLTARLGVAALGVIRPLPHLATPPVRLRAIVAEVFRRSEQPATAKDA